MQYQVGKHEGYECATLTLRGVRLEDGTLITILEVDPEQKEFWERDQQVNLFLLNTFLQRELWVQASGLLAGLGADAEPFLSLAFRGDKSRLFYELLESRLLRMVERQIRHMLPDALQRIFPPQEGRPG